MSAVALLLAAGRGERLGYALPKAFVPLAGRPLLVWACEALAAVPEVAGVIPVVPPGALGRARSLLQVGPAAAKLLPPIAGGAERQDSVRAGVDALPADADFVLVHDAARALVRPATVSRVLREARRGDAAILAVPARDTIKRVAGGRVVETPARSQLWAAQTPQVFRSELLREALAKAAAEGFRGTDDAELVERLGVAVRVVEGDPDNWKITHPEDVAAAEAWLARRAREGAGA